MVPFIFLYKDMRVHCQAEFPAVSAVRNINMFFYDGASCFFLLLNNAGFQKFMLQCFLLPLNNLMSESFAVSENISLLSTSSYVCICHAL